MLTLLAVGSWFGADHVSWQIAEELKPGAAFQVHLCRHPVDLLSYINAGDEYVILDAVCTGQARGRLLKIDINSGWQTSGGNSHGLSLIDVLKLAALVTEPAEKRVQLYGVEAGENTDQPFTEGEVRCLAEQLTAIMAAGSAATQ
ncbi:hypothetical protein [Reinekea marinisedimentorum]|uniref:Ni,Fe-hydrogenase maturation factor n=1 Tax=Reinekea marinisedimentorum TaxID=230495 RepID=A0A4R3I4G9_9GAMM|nr:hypothetical protein [Reinekea marinisedimentorum]TCS40126.1 Ni,Fe-hydrogenase maturation factor [Reinekea marinisedimentorum]